ncbi:MAG: RelA/SpoT family protein [Bacilli bacterium]|nr:RelA/SpoT family protein [Bacilli bacterium]
MEDNRLYNNLMSLCNENDYTNEEIDLINKAYNFALKQHKGMTRKNGEDYIVHPLNVAIIVADLKVDAITVVAALVHETIMHGSSNLEELKEQFGDEVSSIVESLTKVNKLHLVDDSESSSIYIRKILVALSEDVRVLILKLAGRVHNMRTIEGLPPELQKNKARETENVLIPIAHRLGINKIKAELEDLSFKVLRPDIYNQIESELPENRADLNIQLNSMMDDISNLLEDEGIKNFSIKCRVKSVSSISNKLTNGHTWSNIYDILGIRIICNTVPECYLIIGLIHSKYRPIPKRFKDYIAMPKGNSYQSLHTGIYGVNNYPVEIQVRTNEMNEIAEHGIASHWSYKEHGTKMAQSVMEQKLQMFRNAIVASEDEDDESFESNLNNEILAKMIYVNTPKGDVVELPKGSTPVDFAYRIHSRVGDTCIGANVNNSIVTLDYELQDGDVVSIRTDANSTPNKDWLNFVKTTQAKTKIKSFFSKQDREEYIARGEELLERELRKQKISISDALTDEHKEKIMEDLNVSTFDEVLLQIGSLRYTPTYIINLLYNDKENVEDVLLDKIINNNTNIETNYKADIIVSGNDDILVNLASCCKPVYGDDIIGYITKGHGITVHRKDCINIKDIDERLIDVEWNNSRESAEDKKYSARLIIYTNGISNKLLDIVTIASQDNISIANVSEVNGNNTSYYDILVRVPNNEILKKFINDISAIKFVTDIRRI